MARRPVSPDRNASGREDLWYVARTHPGAGWAAEDDAKAWFAIYCRNEFKVEEALRELDHDVYCPTETKWHRENRIRRIVRWPLLPGYVFVGLKATLRGPDGMEFPFDAVRMIEGVVNFVRAGEKPARIPYDPPSAEAEAARLKVWRERGPQGWDGRPPQEPPPRALSLGEIRDMEAAGAFDQTQDRIVAEQAAKLVRRRFTNFTELAVALREMDAA